MADLVKLTVFLTTMSDLPEFRTVRNEFVDTDRPPASSLVQVSGLVHPAFRVEIEALATLPPRECFSKSAEPLADGRDADGGEVAHR